MKKILFIGQQPEIVDFSDPALPPDTNAHGPLQTSPLSRTTEIVPDKIPLIVAVPQRR
jgi:hypothetical protein